MKWYRACNVGVRILIVVFLSSSPGHTQTHWHTARQTECGSFKSGGVVLLFWPTCQCLHSPLSFSWMNGLVQPTHWGTSALYLFSTPPHWLRSHLPGDSDTGLLLPSSDWVSATKLRGKFTIFSANQCELSGILWSHWFLLGSRRSREREREREPSVDQVWIWQTDMMEGLLESAV